MRQLTRFTSPTCRPRSPWWCESIPIRRCAGLILRWLRRSREGCAPMRRVAHKLWRLEGNRRRTEMPQAPPRATQASPQEPQVHLAGTKLDKADFAVDRADRAARVVVAASAVVLVATCSRSLI